MSYSKVKDDTREHCFQCCWMTLFRATMYSE